MNAQKAGWLAAALLVPLALGVAHGATLYKWVDADGNVTYQDTPPPNNVQYEESTVDAPPAPLPEDAERQIEEAALDNPVSLYSVPDCDACALVRLYLESNSIPFAEKDVRNNLDTQAELEQRAGSLTVPTLTVGDRVLDGYSRSAIRDALVEAGFPVDRPTPAAAESGGSGEEPATSEIASPEQPVAEIENSDSNQQ